MMRCAGRSEAVLGQCEEGAGLEHAKGLGKELRSIATFIVTCCA